jgi:hypothetical protein
LMERFPSHRPATCVGSRTFTTVLMIHIHSLKIQLVILKSVRKALHHRLLSLELQIVFSHTWTGSLGMGFLYSMALSFLALLSWSWTNLFTLAYTALSLKYLSPFCSQCLICVSILATQLY